jgi:hypothetical protein
MNNSVYPSMAAVFDEKPIKLYGAGGLIKK